jgi:hypothetical protein
MDTHLRAELLVDALQIGYPEAQAIPGACVPLGPGRSAHTSLSFGKRREDEGLVPSIGRVGSAYDTAWSRALWPR